MSLSIKRGVSLVDQSVAEHDHTVLETVPIGGGVDITFPATLHVQADYERQASTNRADLY